MRNPCMYSGQPTETPDCSCELAIERERVHACASKSSHVDRAKKERWKQSCPKRVCVCVLDSGRHLSPSPGVGLSNIARTNWDCGRWVASSVGLA